MKNALILTGMWIGIVLSAYMIVYWDGGSDWLPVSVLNDLTPTMSYVHPQGLFGAYVPPEWSVSEETWGIQAADADERVTVWIMAIQEEDLTAAVEEAIGLVGDSLGDMLMFDAWPAGDADPSGRLLLTTVSDETGVRFIARAQPAEQGSVVMIIMGGEEDVAGVGNAVDRMWEDLQVPAEPRVLL